MVHLRIVVPSHNAEHALDLLRETPSVANLIYLERAAHKPEGDVILCDVAREDASVVLADLRELKIDIEGSIAMERIDTEISLAGASAVAAARGSSVDAVIWEEVESRTEENVELSFSYFAFMTLACMIAAVGIMLDAPILVIGGMILGPDFGPIAGLCVAAVQRRRSLGALSAKAVVSGFALGIVASYLFTKASIATDLVSSDLTAANHPLTNFISHPDGMSIVVALIAGIAGMLSLTSTKSGALIGVLVSVTTIPAAAYVGVAAAYSDFGESLGALAQLAANLGGLLAAGVTTLFIQRLLYRRRRVDHLHDHARAAAGLPVGSSRRATVRD